MSEARDGRAPLMMPGSVNSNAAKLGHRCDGLPGCGEMGEPQVRQLRSLPVHEDVARPNVSVGDTRLVQAVGGQGRVRHRTQPLGHRHPSAAVSRLPSGKCSVE